MTDIIAGEDLKYGDIIKIKDGYAYRITAIDKYGDGEKGNCIFEEWVENVCKIFTDENYSTGKRLHFYFNREKYKKYYNNGKTVREMIDILK